MKRPGYREAINWIAREDDTEFLSDANPADGASVTCSLVCDLFGVPIERVVADVQRAVAIGDAK